MAALAQMQETEKALELLKELRQRGQEACAPTYGVAISACQGGALFERALELLQEMNAECLDPDTTAYNAAIGTCEKAAKGQQAVQLLTQMKAAALQPTALSYNTVISACDTCNMTDAAAALFREMSANSGRSAGAAEVCVSAAGVSTKKDDDGDQRQTDAPPQIFRVDPADGRAHRSEHFAARYGTDGQRQWDAAQEAPVAPRMWRSRDGLYVTPFVRDSEGPQAEITKLRRHGDAIKALALFDSLSPAELTVGVYNSGLAACSACSAASRATELLAEMHAMVVRPDNISYASAINARVQTDDVMGAVGLLSEMRKCSIPPGTGAGYNTVIAALAKAAQSDAALRLFDEMGRLWVPRTVPTYSSAITAAAEAHRSGDASELLRSMKAVRLRPDTVTYNAAMTACEKGANSSQALVLLADMVAAGLQPDEVSCWASTSACDDVQRDSAPRRDRRRLSHDEVSLLNSLPPGQTWLR
eukprot:TRINITY_DN7882_c0_g1_i5.p1 TRINITY_DN7882_c0_g1~~TRINITY_DN7882_c0_g1_i5.p1  ORF type:complete len:529 (+),score=126.15 TRINITY_DN7882_c0_g1_i5:163-1587(+)